MASHTDSGILPHRFLAARNPMRIVTSGAFQFSAALEETARLPQPVNRAYRLEFAFVPGARRVVERDREIYQGLSRHIRERAPVESLERRRDAPAGGFEVALHTHLRDRGIAGNRSPPEVPRGTPAHYRAPGWQLVCSDSRHGRTCTYTRRTCGSADVACRTRAPCPIPRLCQGTSPAAIRSACHARCGADTSGHGFPTPLHNRFSLLRR